MKEPMTIEQKNTLPVQGDIFAPAGIDEQVDTNEVPAATVNALAIQQDALDLALARYDLEVMQKAQGNSAITDAAADAQIVPAEEKKSMLRYLFGQPNAYAMLLEKRQKMAA